MKIKPRGEKKVKDPEGKDVTLSAIGTLTGQGAKGKVKLTKEGLEITQAQTQEEPFKHWLAMGKAVIEITEKVKSSKGKV